MCLSYTREQKRATKDIICFKYGKVKGEWFIPTYYLNFHYIKGLYTPHVPLIPEPLVGSAKKIEAGYHSFNFLKQAKDDIGTGHGHNIIGIFIIPSGIEYHEGKFGSHESRVSSQLMYFGKYNWWNRHKLRKKYGKNCLDGLI